MNFLCPSCRTALPSGAQQVVCSGCGVAVDLARAQTAPGQARLWPEVDLSGEALGGYALGRLIGSGGMGSVYEATTATGALVALKVLAPLLAAEPALRERFRREAQALGALRHPAVVQMLDQGEERGFCWYAMERVEGEDLRERLKRGPLAPFEVVELGAAMLDALEVVHGAGLIHRDVKPSNILLSRAGAKLCDFGIARFEGASTLTESAALLGSLRYMAPEQRWGKSDARSDLYALGVVLHEALAQGVPGERALPPRAGAALVRTIARLTALSPARRPSSAAEAKLLLRGPGKRWAQLAAGAVGLAVIATGSWLTGRTTLLNSVEPPFDAGVALVEVEPVPASPVVTNFTADAGLPLVDAELPPKSTPKKKVSSKDKAAPPPAKTANAKKQRAP